MPFGGQKICTDCREELLLRKTRIGDNSCRKCGRALYREDEYCADCKSHTHAFDRGLSLFIYNDPVRRSIAYFKYKGRQEYADYYAEEMVRSLGRQILSLKPDVLIPVPISTGRRKKRGYNQAELLADRIGKLLKIRVEKDLMVRVRDTAPQKELGRAGRRKNLKRGFKIRADVVKLKTAIIIDDIYTTGSTADEMARVLKKAGTDRVYVVTLSSGIAA